jgi:hypothetical protein
VRLNKKNSYFVKSNASGSYKEKLDLTAKRRKSGAYTLGAHTPSDYDGSACCASNLPWLRFRQFNSGSGQKSHHTFCDHEADVESYCDNANCGTRVI